MTTEPEQTGATGQTGDAGVTDTTKTTQTGATNDDSLLDMAGDKPTSKYTPGQKPEGLDDTLWDTEKNTFKADALYEKLTAQEKIAKDLREKMGRKGAPPEKADDYKFEIPEDAPWKDAIKSDDPVMKAVRETAHKLGLSQGQYAPLVKEALDAMYKAQVEAQAPVELTAEQKAEAREAEIAKIGPNGPAVVRAVSEFVRQNAGVHFDEETMGYIKDISTSAEGVKLLNTMREMIGGERLPMAGMDPESVSGLPPDKDILSFMGTKEYQSGDPAAHAKYDRWMILREKAGRPVYLQA